MRLVVFKCLPFLIVEDLIYRDFGGFEKITITTVMKFMENVQKRFGQLFLKCHQKPSGLSWMDVDGWSWIPFV